MCYAAIKSQIDDDDNDVHDFILFLFIFYFELTLYNVNSIIKKIQSSPVEVPLKTISPNMLRLPGKSTEKYKFASESTYDQLLRLSVKYLRGIK